MNSGPDPGRGPRQFDSLRASTLYCRRCGQAMPVRESLLLVLPGKEVHDYACRKCGDSLGKREVSTGAAGSGGRGLWTP